MRYIRPSNDGNASRHYAFSLSKGEKLALLATLNMFPLLEPTSHRLSRKPKTTSAAEQEWLEEAMAQQQRELKKKLGRLFRENASCFTESSHGVRLELTGEQLEWLLRVLNDIRVGSWMRLGQPEIETARRAAAETGQPHLLAALDLCGHFQSVLLEPFA